MLLQKRPNLILGCQSGRHLPHNAHSRQRTRPLYGSPPPTASSRRRPLRVLAAAAEPFKPERPFHKGVVDPVEPEGGPRLLGRFTFSDAYYWLNLVYWSLLLAAVLTGNEALSRAAAFGNYSTAMFASSAAFTAYHLVRFVQDLRHHLKVGFVRMQSTLPR